MCVCVILTRYAHFHTWRFVKGPDHFGEDDPTIDTIAAQLPLAQISTISIEEILGDISESRCLRYLHRWEHSKPEQSIP